MFILAMGLGSPTEITLIAGVIILLFGGPKIAEFGKLLGQGIKDFKMEVSTQDAISENISASTLASESSVSTTPPTSK